VGDANFKQKAEAAITDKINSEITVILVSHSEAQMKRLCERVIWLNDGAVKAEGETEFTFSMYEINNLFSNLGVIVNFCELNKEFVLAFEKLEFKHGKITFNCVLINMDDKIISNPKCIEHGAFFVEMEGPFPTPAYKNRFHPFKNTGFNRYQNGSFYVNEKYQLTVDIDGGRVVVLTLLLNENGVG